MNAFSIGSTDSASAEFLPSRSPCQDSPTNGRPPTVDLGGESDKLEASILFPLFEFAESPSRMPINVICSGCKKQFKVSEKFAGKKGPCPKCKAVITIPEKMEEVVVHAPENFGPKDAKGQAVLKPIAREDAKFSAVMAVGVGLGAILIVLIGLAVRWSVEDKSQFPMGILALGALLIGPPAVFGGYAALRGDDIAPHKGLSLLARIGICTVVYALIWALVAFVNSYVFDSEGFSIPMLAVLIPLMILAGGGVAFASLDLEFFSGLVHYGLYLIVTVLMRLLVGISAFPLAE